MSVRHYDLASPTYHPERTQDAPPRQGRREPRVTPLLATLCCLLLGLALAACGGNGPKKETYQKAVSKQEACCNGLAGAARDQCLGGIVRVDDPEVQASDANLATYACVEKHFACDPATGTATKPSAQAQLDCINDL
jgi:hypothetical protein